MVGRGALALFVAAGSAAAAFGVAAAPQSFSIRSVQVVKDGQWDADPYGQQTPEECARFRLPQAVALRWFRASREVGQHAWLEELDWTQCSASGTLVTGDGRSYAWDLDQSGRGRIVVSPTLEVYLSGPELPFSRR